MSKPIEGDYLLRCCCMPYKTITGLDGIVAAVKDGYVITSPNQTFVPQPHWGLSEVSLRSDLRYGMDDYTLWPQIFLQKFPHLPAIPRQPQDLCADISAMWWNPTLSDFKQSTTVFVAGVGTLGGPQMLILGKLQNQLKCEVNEVLQNGGVQCTLVTSCFSVMIHTWDRLQLHARFEEKILELTEFQRVWLELRGALTWRLKIHERLVTGFTAPAQVFNECIGAFTDNATVAQECFSAGVPVWLVRPVDACLGNIRIDKVVDLTLPNDIRLDARQGHEYPIVYKGPNGVPDRYMQMHRFTRTRMVWASPWGVEIEEIGDRSDGLHISRVASTSRSIDEIKRQPALVIKPAAVARSNSSIPIATMPNSLTLSGSPSSTLPSKLPAALKSSSTSPAPFQRSKFQGLKDPLGPTAVQAWEAGLQAVKTVDNKSKARAKIPELYAFPEPGIFFPPGGGERGPKLLKHWMQSRDFWLLRGHDKVLTPKLWKACLLHGLGTGNPDINLSPKAFEAMYNVMAQYGCRLEDLQGKLMFDDMPSQPAPTSDGTVRWRGKVIQWVDGEYPDAQIVKEVIWELCELNFRAELIRMDSLMSTHHTLDQQLARQEALVKCFADSSSTDLKMPPSLPGVGGDGLGSKNLKYRGPFIMALADLMGGWTHKHVVPVELLLYAHNQGQKESDIQLLRLEKALAKLYCQTFYHEYGRAPSIPYYI